MSITQKGRMLNLPLLVLRGLVCFPESVMHFDVGRLKSVAALNETMEKDQCIFLVAQKDINCEDPDPSGLHRMGVVAKVRQIVKLPQDNFRVIVEGRFRATAVEILQTEPYFRAIVEERVDRPVTPALLEDALVRECQELFDHYVDLVPKLAPDVVLTVAGAKRAGFLADYVASNLSMPPEEKQRVLNLQSISSRMETLLRILGKECQILELEKKFVAKVQVQMDENQKEYYLREQIRAISEELGEADDPMEESGEYKKAIDQLQLPESLAAVLHKECGKLAKMPFGSHEATVVRTYLDACLALPWNTTTKDSLDLKRARRILDRDHDGLDKVKERIVEALAVRQLSAEMKGQGLCLGGPPGVGKTSIARSIAEAMGRKYVRVSLGGVRDESEIRGHRRTYVGAMPGGFMAAI